VSNETETPVGELSYTDASHELDEIVAFFEQREVDVDRLVERLERATAIVDELDRRLRRTRAQVEQLVPRLEAAARAVVDEDGETEDAAGGDDRATGGQDGDEPRGLF
jgi:exodeoxyribonuclease VII small subunit